MTFEGFDSTFETAEQIKMSILVVPSVISTIRLKKLRLYEGDLHR
jgi:hypothetical protein